MSRTITLYCSCSTCTQIRNEQPKHHRYFASFRHLFPCSCCLTKRKLIVDNQQTFSPLNKTKPSTITFRDIDITNKHCSKHDVMVKATRPNFSRMKNEELRQRVKEANQRWTRMSILPANLIDFIFTNKDFIPLCTNCYENLSPLTFNLCHICIRTATDYQEQMTMSSSSIDDDGDTSPTIPDTSIVNDNDEDIESFSTDYV